MTDEETTIPASSPEDQPAEDLQGKLDQLMAELEKERAAATDYMKKWQYAQAELVNVRRRLTQERDEASKFGNLELVYGTLEVLDHLERAERTIPASLTGLSWITGIVLIRQLLEHAVQRAGVEVVDIEAGAPFDPSLHQSVSSGPHGTVSEGHVVEVVQRGYRLHGRLLRPALVTLSTGAPEDRHETVAPASASGEAGPGEAPPHGDESQEP
ncbi:MAG: nucleotide exchange factor GrpE [Chloroflexi bacterium]|nr:nucleotide exchange factor GrpE [Chloroflexota bacterium]